ncbi:hypothetical protein BH11BAC1_BH11BAC1_13480 [soil metagenome]
MPLYQRLGKIPSKRHIVFRQPDGNLYHEELIGTEGFSGISTLAYHLNLPTMVKEHGKRYSVRPEIAVEDKLQARSFSGFEVTPEEDYIQSRKVLFVNDDLQIGLASPCKGTIDYFLNMLMLTKCFLCIVVLVF